MKLFFKSFLILTIFFKLNGVNAQQCCIVNAEKINFHTDTTNYPIFVEYEKKSDSIDFKIINVSGDTIYLFKSYFDKDFYSSKFINRVSLSKRTYKISLIPIVPYLSTRLTDRIVIGEKKLITTGQITYNFVKLAPNSYYNLKIAFNDLFKDQPKANDLVKDFDSYLQNKFSNPHFKEYSSSKLRGKYQLSFQFSYYTMVNLLCNIESYYLDEIKFNQQAKSFKIIKFPIGTPLVFPHERDKILSD